jgi:hypothetical protein
MEMASPPNGDRPQASAKNILGTILSMIRDDDDQAIDSEHIDFRQYAQHEEKISRTGEILEDITFLRREIVNAREDILVDKLESMKKINDELSERLVEALETIRYLANKGEVPRTQVHALKKLALPITSDSFSNHCEDEDDANSMQRTSRTKLHVENNHENSHDSEGEEIQSLNTDPDVSLEWDGNISIGCVRYASQHETVTLLRQVRRCKFTYRDFIALNQLKHRSLRERLTRSKTPWMIWSRFAF